MSLIYLLRLHVSKEVSSCCPIDQQCDCENGAVLLEEDNVATSLLASSREEEQAAPTDLFSILKN